MSAPAAGPSSVCIADARLVRPEAGSEPRLGGVLVESGSIAAVALTDREQQDIQARLVRKHQFARGFRRVRHETVF